MDTVTQRVGPDHCPYGREHSWVPIGSIAGYPADECERCGAGRLHGIDLGSAIAILCRIGRRWS